MTKKIKTLIMQDGTKHRVTSEDGKYFVCKDKKFRRSNPFIVQIEEKEEKSKPKAKKNTECAEFQADLGVEPSLVEGRENEQQWQKTATNSI